MNLKELRAAVIKNSAKVQQLVDADLAFQIGREVERARMRAGLTQKRLAKLVKTHQASISRLEAGSSLPSLSFLKRIAGALGAQLTAPNFVFAETTNTSPLHEGYLWHDRFFVDESNRIFSVALKSKVSDQKYNSTLDMNSSKNLV